MFIKTASGKRPHVFVTESCTMLFSKTNFCVLLWPIVCTSQRLVGSRESTNVHCAGRPAKHFFLSAQIRIICRSLHSSTTCNEASFSQNCVWSHGTYMQQQILSNSGK